MDPASDSSGAITPATDNGSNGSNGSKGEGGGNDNNTATAAESGTEVAKEEFSSKVEEASSEDGAKVVSGIDAPTSSSSQAFPPSSSTVPPVSSSVQVVPPSPIPSAKLPPAKLEVKCIQVKLGAFVLNKHIFDKSYRIAPLNLPDHSAFLPGPFSAHDAIPQIDVHAAHPWQNNTRIADITVVPQPDETEVQTDERRLRKDRLGVYLHWCLPQRFRGGVAERGAESKKKPAETPSPPGEETVKHAAVPDRWIIFRFIIEATTDPATDEPAPALTAFIVESNRIRQIRDFGSDVQGRPLDIETEAAPFIDSRMDVEEQADVFLGMKLPFDETWEETSSSPNVTYYSPLTLLGSANPLFADFQHHNSNVFSIHDDLTWMEKNGAVRTAVTAKVSYAVFGYFSHPEPDEKLVCHGSLLNVIWNKDKRPDTIEALQFAEKMRLKQPIALGKDSLDAVEAYLRSVEGPTPVFDWPSFLGDMTSVIGQTGRGGVIDAHVAQNLRAGFKPIDGGRRWRLREIDEAQAGETQKQPLVKEEDMKMLLGLDRTQALLDALDRHERYLRHMLYCEWWKYQSLRPGGAHLRPECQRESRERYDRAFSGLKRVTILREKYQLKEEDIQNTKLLATARPQFFSHLAPSVVVGGIGSAWPSDFHSDEPAKERSLDDLPLQTSCGKTWVKNWLQKIVKDEKKCIEHGMDLVLRETEIVDSKPYLKRLPEFFRQLAQMRALRWKSPGWVRDAVEALSQEFAYSMDPDNSFNCSEHSPMYLDITRGDIQPWRPLFVQWEVEYYHIPRRFWTLQKAADGTAKYSIAPDINISSYDSWERHKRVINGRTLLRPNAEWAITTLLSQMLAKLDPSRLDAYDSLKSEKDKLRRKLQTELSKINLLAGSLESLSDHLLTLHQGMHIMPYKKKKGSSSPLDISFLSLFGESQEGFDVTPYGESLFSDPLAGRDFKPVTHGQARFTKFDVVDRFGQAITPIEKEGKLYPCLGPAMACGQNEVEGTEFANSVELDMSGFSQYFQIGHRINQDARLNTDFVVNSTDWEEYSSSTQWFKGDPGKDGNPPQNLWRRVTEYENPVWGWLVVDYRDRGIQVYDPEGELMGEALLPSTIDGRVYWQVYYHVYDKPRRDGSQLQQLLDSLSDAKFLLGLWSTLSEACQHIIHTPSAYDSQLLNLVGRPMALVNIAISLELATAPMQTQSYHDLSKPAEGELEAYKFEVLMGDRSNLHDGLVGYFHLTPLSDEEAPSTQLWQRRPDLDCVYTEFGYPERRPVDAETKKNTFAKPAARPIYVSPCFIDPTNMKQDNPVAYSRAWATESATTIVGAIVDPFQSVHFATGILPLSTLTLPSWIIGDALKKMRMLFRGGALMLQGDLPMQDNAAAYLPLNEITLEAGIPPITDDGNWSWLQPMMEEGFQTTFVPYNLKPVAPDYPLLVGPQTCLEGFYKFGLKQIKEEDANFLTDRPLETGGSLISSGLSQTRKVRLRGKDVIQPTDLKFARTSPNIR